MDAQPDFQADSRRHLRCAIDLVWARLADALGQTDGRTPDVGAAEEALAQMDAGCEVDTALESICEHLGLSGFERDVLVMCAGVEFVPAFGRWVRDTAGRADGLPTFEMALSALPGADWSATGPQAPLRRWKLVEADSTKSLTRGSLRVDERILHFLAGDDVIDARLEPLVEHVELPATLSESHRQLAEEVAGSFRSASADQRFPVAQLCGRSPASRRQVAGVAAAMLGCRLYRIKARDIGPDAGGQHELAVLWDRETLLAQRALLVEVQDGERAERQALAAFLDRLASPTFVSAREAVSLRGGRSRRWEVGRLSSDEQRQLWQRSLGPLAGRLNGQLDQIIGHFELHADAIETAGAAVRRQVGVAGAEVDELADELWQACVRRGRPQLDELAHRIDPRAGWDDLVLPEHHKDVLRTIAAHVRGRMTVYEQWGFAEKSSRGLGIAAIFAGASGTGKTMAAEVLAGELALDLYRIDLSSVVSKYIGETEKNLRRIFDAAEGVGAILLFDEADALFGKRSDVKDSHDRYANLEVSYLLQRMEAYRGLAILTTNLKDAIDSAFSRRVRFVLDFPFPGTQQRAEIWRRVFPDDTPTEQVDPRRLASLNVTGGNIRNIALNAAFLAADDDQPVRMDHLIRAARAEYSKLGKRLDEAKLRGER